MLCFLKRSFIEVTKSLRKLIVIGTTIAEHTQDWIKWDTRSWLEQSVVKSDVQTPQLPRSWWNDRLLAKDTVSNPCIRSYSLAIVAYPRNKVPKIIHPIFLFFGAFHLSCCSEWFRSQTKSHRTIPLSPPNIDFSNQPVCPCITTLFVIAHNRLLIDLSPPSGYTSPSPSNSGTYYGRVKLSPSFRSWVRKSPDRPKLSTKKAQVAATAMLTTAM